LTKWLICDIFFCSFGKIYLSASDVFWSVYRVLLSQSEVVMQKAIRVCTLNVGMPQVSVFGRRLEPVPCVNERLALLPDFIRSLRADVVFLQELFHARHRQVLMDRLGEVYPHATFHDDAGALSLSNGLLCLSRFPLVDARFTPFADRCWEERLFVSKGFQDFGIQVGCDVIKVAHTHLTAGGFFSHPEQKKYDAIRTNQIRQMLQQFSLSELGLVVGDFNTGPEVSVLNYQQLTAGLHDVFHGALEREGSAVTWDPQNRLNVDGPHKMCPPQRIDLMLCTDSFRKKYSVSAYRTHGHESPMPVSDHWAVAVDFVPCLKEQPLRMTFLRGFVFVRRVRCLGRCLGRVG
jgi:endonuclease/exonuclease/phosphatase family metal-dependent hydrolase